jgi:hypothetical protein
MAQTAAVPAGPALVGFSVDIRNNSNAPAPVVCSLVDNNQGTVFATAAQQALPFGSTFYTFATTQVVNLPTATSLTVQCTSYQPGLFFTYQDLSIYAISFAP